MRRGGCARRAMLGAVAAGALLGAARGAYTINLDNQEDDGGSTERTDDEYKVKKTSGLEIVIGPSAGSVYDIAPAGTGLDIEVVGGTNDPDPGPDFASCPGGYTLDATSGDIVCYGVARGLQDTSVVVTEGAIAVTDGVDVYTDSSETGVFDWATCTGDIDVKITGEIVCYTSTVLDNDVVVTNTDPNTARSFTVSGKNSAGNAVPSFDVDTNCPGGITIPASKEIVCYDVARGDALVTNTADENDDSGSIVVTESNSEETTIAGASGTITVNGGDTLGSAGTNYKIELNTGNGDFKETETLDNGLGTVDVTVIVDDGDGTVTVTETKPDGTVTKTITVSDDNVPQSRKTTVTAPDANEDENIVDVTVTVTEETANSDTPYFPGTVTDVEETKTVTVKDGTVITSKNEFVDKTTTADSVQTKTMIEREYTAPFEDLDFVEKTKEETVTVTAPNDEIDDLLSGIEAPDSFAAGTVITIVRKSADDDGELKLETDYVKTELTEAESVTTTFFLTGDDSLPDPDGGEEDVTAGKYLDLFEEELSSSLTVAEYRLRLPAGGKLPASFKDKEEIKGEAIIKFEIEGTFDDPSRLALTANLTTQVSGTSSRKLLQQGGVTQKETEFRSQIDDDDNIEESLKEVEKDANGNVIRFSANEIKIEEDPKTGFITLTEIETVNGGTADQVVTENELVLTSIGGSTVSTKITVNDKNTFCDPPFAIACGGSGSAPAPSPDNGGGGGGGPAPVPSPDNGGGGGGGGSPTPGNPGNPDTDPDVPVPDPDVPVPDPDVPGGGGETPAPPAPPAVSCAVSGRKKKRQCNQKPAGKCIFQKKGKRCLALPANGGLCTAFTRRKVCRRAGSPCVWTGGRKRGSCGPAQ